MREIRDNAIAREFILHSMWMSRVQQPNAKNLEKILAWAMTLINDGDPMPPIGVIADIGLLAEGVYRSSDKEFRRFAGVESTLIRKYEDYVLGKLLSDLSFERGSQALMKFEKGRDREKGTAFVVSQILQRSGYEGILISPSIVKNLMKEDPKKLLEDSLTLIQDQEGMMPEVISEYEAVIGKVRNLGSALGPEDETELQTGTAIDEFGQRLAMRQVVKASVTIESNSPQQKLKPLRKRQQISTNISDEDMYPIGGFTSISTKGTIESLLHSQLAFIEKEEELRPDLFDVKFLRGELLYYSRDENQFFRRRQNYLFALHPSLVNARVKDSDLPYQRIIMTLGMLYASVRKISDWLSEDALRFEFIFLQNQNKLQLEDEFNLCNRIMGERIENGTAEVKSMSIKDFAPYADEVARTSHCNSMVIGTKDFVPKVEVALVDRLILGAKKLTHKFDVDTTIYKEAEFERYDLLFERLLGSWI